MKKLKVNGKFSGSFSIGEIKFSEIQTREITRHNKFGGRIGFPDGDVGKIVYILFPEENQHENKKSK